VGETAKWIKKIETEKDIYIYIYMCVERERERGNDVAVALFSRVLRTSAVFLLFVVSPGMQFVLQRSAAA